MTLSVELVCPFLA